MKSCSKLFDYSNLVGVAARPISMFRHDIFIFLLRLFCGLNIPQNSPNLACISGLVKNLILLSRFLNTPAGTCRGRYTKSHHLFPYNFQTVHHIFKCFISTCSGDCYKSSDVGHAHFHPDLFFGYAPKCEKPPFTNSS